jgi:hypothetical protein
VFVDDGALHIDNNHTERWPNSRLDELLPKTWKAARAVA